MHCTANAMRVHYELSGRESGPLVALSHSLACNLSMWDPQMAMLESRFRVLRYDTRGHGQSEATPPPYSLDQLADDAIALFDALGFDTVHWVGLSMGGMIGQNLALRYPERLSSLALCDTAATIPDAAQQTWQQRIDTANSAGMQALVDDTLGRWYTPEYQRDHPEAIEPIRQSILSTPPAGFVGCAEAIRRLDLLDRLDQIALPSVVIVGEDDPGTPPSASRAIHEQLKDSTLVIIPNAAHLSNREQAEAFNDALGAHLERVSS